MKIGYIAYAVVEHDYCSYHTEKVKIKEEVNDNMFRVQSISNVGTFGVFKDLLFRIEDEAREKITEIFNAKEQSLRNSIKSKEELIKYMYSHIESELERTVVKEKIKELLDINIG